MKSLYGKDFFELNVNTRYGYVTNSKVKFVIVVDSSNTSLRDNEIRSVSRHFPEDVIAVKDLYKWLRLVKVQIPQLDPWAKPGIDSWTTKNTANSFLAS